MTDFVEYLAADRRLVMLRVLQNSAAYTTNEYMLLTMTERMGHVVSTDKLRTEVAWLAEQGLVKVDKVGGVAVITLTQRGLDVSAGSAMVPGVQRPRPGE